MLAWISRDTSWRFRAIWPCNHHLSSHRRSSHSLNGPKIYLWPKHLEKKPYDRKLTTWCCENKRAYDLEDLLLVHALLQQTITCLVDLLVACHVIFHEFHCKRQALYLWWDGSEPCPRDRTFTCPLSWVCKYTMLYKFWHVNTIKILQQEESLRFLKGWVMTWNLRRIDFSCPFCAAGVGRSNYHPVLKSINYVRRYSGKKTDQNHVDKRILGGKGLQYKDSTSITFVRPVHIIYYNIVQYYCILIPDFSIAGSLMGPGLTRTVSCKFLLGSWRQALATRQCSWMHLNRVFCSSYQSKMPNHLFSLQTHTHMIFVYIYSIYLYRYIYMYVYIIQL